jgi:hypothetical protein
MPHHFEFDEKHRILLVVVEGEYGDDEQLGMNAAIRKRATELSVSAGIGDMSGVTAFNVSPTVLQMSAREPAPYEPQTPRFLVATADLVYGMSRMYQIVGDKSRLALQVVRSRAEALEALGVKDAIFAPVD